MNGEIAFMKKIIKEINQNKNLEANLPLYANGMAELFYKRSIVELSMEYVTLYEMLTDFDDKNGKLGEIVNNINYLIDCSVISTCVDKKREEALDQIETLRKTNTEIVETLTSYADIFSRYEYISNRCEYNFKDTSFLNNFNDEDFTREIMQYIFSDEDNTAINGKISEIIGELPVRLTKNKFFELLDQGMNVYKQTDKQTIDDFVYMLRTSGILDIPENINKINNLYEIYEDIQKIDYSSLDSEGFKKQEDMLRIASSIIEESTNIHMMLQGIINKIYAIIILKPYAETEDKALEAGKKIIALVNASFNDNDFLTLPEEIEDLFIFMEGVPEEIQRRIQSDEYALDIVSNSHMDLAKSILCDKIYESLFLSQQLLSDSLFIELSLDYEEEQEDFDINSYIFDVKDKMIKDLMSFFEGHHKLMNKSVMAVILSRLPVFFNNITEVQEYVYNSISKCTNNAEKAAVIEIVKSIMEN